MRAIVPVMLLCCFIMKACGSTADELHEGWIHKRSTAEGSSQDRTVLLESSNDSESGDASLFQDTPEDEEESVNDSEASSEVNSSADDHDSAENAAETDNDEDNEDDKNERDREVN